MLEPATVGLVLGSVDATPLEFWLGVCEGQRLQLDDLVSVETKLPGDQKVRYYGVVDLVRKRYEGAQFDTDVFRVAAGSMPVEVTYAAHVQVTRIEPEVFVPPHPGDRAVLVTGEAFERALSFDRMDRKLAIGSTRSGEVVYANLEFLEGTRGAHVSISGVSGVATKTSYATFLLYSMFHSDSLGADAINAKALIFNVKGEELLWLDRDNLRADASVKEEYRRLGLPAGPFRSVGLYAPARPRGATPMPDTGGRQAGVRPYVWTLRELARDRLLHFAFPDADDTRAQVSFVVERVENRLELAAREGPADDPGLTVSGRRLTRFEDLVELLDGDELDQIAPSFTSATLDAFRRRLSAASQRIGRLVRGDDGARGRGIHWGSHQVTVVDIHTLHPTAQTFVVGVLLKQIMEQKERQGTSRPLVFVVLDELNKYAPRDGGSPLHGILLDIAERGRSLGISLFGAQQTASEVERRVVGNASLKVVGRLDAAESQRGEYGFLTKSARQRATMLQPGSMIVSQPEIATPLLLRFPFPTWATRQSEAVVQTERDPFERVED
jgi:uncharacterized protein